MSGNMLANLLILEIWWYQLIIHKMVFFFFLIEEFIKCVDIVLFSHELCYPNRWSCGSINP